MKKILLFLLLALPFYLIVSLNFLDKEAFICPVKYQHEMIVRSDRRGNGLFGTSRNGNRTHDGLDLFAAVGTAVYASRSGVVTAARGSAGMGNFVVIRHWGNFTTIYGHLLRINVHKYQLVRQGQVIGQVGKSGNANYRDIQPHLHFEVRKNGVPEDPLGYLP